MDLGRWTSAGVIGWCGFAPHMGDISRSPCVTSASLPRVFTTFLSVPHENLLPFQHIHCKPGLEPRQESFDILSTTVNVLPLSGGYHPACSSYWTYLQKSELVDSNHRHTAYKAAALTDWAKFRGSAPTHKGQTLDREMWGFLPKCTRAESNRLYSTITDGCTLMKGG